MGDKVCEKFRFFKIFGFFFSAAIGLVLASLDSFSSSALAASTSFHSAGSIRSSGNRERKSVVKTKASLKDGSSDHSCVREESSLTAMERAPAEKEESIGDSEVVLASDQDSLEAFTLK